MKVYLFQCNHSHDIENNINEVIIPEFTIENVNKIDSNYKRYFSDIVHMEYELDDNKYDKRSIKELENQLQLNELFLEHIYYISKLRIMATEYAVISEKYRKIFLYFTKIITIIQKDNNNLEKVIEILYSFKYSMI